MTDQIAGTRLRADMLRKRRETRLFAAPAPFGAVSWRGNVGNSTFEALQANVRRAYQNGLLLSALWDCAFDSGLISFSDVGVVLRSHSLSDAAALALRIDSVPAIIGLTDLHRQSLKRHRTRHGFFPEGPGTGEV